MYPYRAKGWNAHTWFSVSGSYIGTYAWAGSIEQEEIFLRHQTRSIATLGFIARPWRRSTFEITLPRDRKSREFIWYFD